MNMQSFLDQMKAKAEAKAKEMAKLELSFWNSLTEAEYKTREAEMIEHFGFTAKKLKARKIQLQKDAA